MRRLRPALVLAIFAVLLYDGFAMRTVGQFHSSPFNYYDLLGEAFLAGQLHLKVTPKPELVALPNPYDPAQNAGLRLHDAALFQGRYYLYWGPVPGLLHATWRLLTGLRLYDSIVGVVGALVVSAAFTLILQRVRQRYLSGGADWVVWGSSAAFAGGGIMLFLVGRPSVYHEAVVVAMAFLMAAWYSFLLACESGAPRRWYLVVSGLLLGCSVGSRFTYLTYAAGLAFVLGWAVLRADRRARGQRFFDLASFGAPIVVSVLLLMLYNLLRFDSPIEFGTPYVLQGSSAYYEATRRPDGTTGSFFSLAQVIPHLILYLFAIPSVSLSYPYLSYAWTPYDGSGFLFPNVSRYAGSTIEAPILSVFLLAPVGLLTLMLPRVLVSGRPVPLGAPRVWASGILIGLILMLLLLSASRGATTRYSADILPAFTLLGSLNLLALSAGAIDRRSLPPWASLGRFALGAWAVSLLVGGLLGIGAWLL